MFEQRYPRFLKVKDAVVSCFRRSSDGKNSVWCEKNTPIVLLLQKKFIPLQRFRETESYMVAVVQLVRASDCGSECRRFESDQPPKGIRNQYWFLIPFY